MPNTTTTCYKTPFNVVETKQQPAAKIRQSVQPNITVTPYKTTLLERIKTFIKRTLRVK
jgi:hypothetical protein